MRCSGPVCSGAYIVCYPSLVLPLEPIRDLLVFDWVVALGSTQQAARSLALPQSSVSRRYRQLSQQFAFQLSRRSGRYWLGGGAETYRLLCNLIQHWRFDHQEFRWCWQPELLPLLPVSFAHASSGTQIHLDHDHWLQRDDYLRDQILDASFEVNDGSCDSPVGLIDIGLHLSIPASHPLLRCPVDQRLQQARQFPLHTPGFVLPSSVDQRLRSEGFVLNTGVADALWLRPGRSGDANSLELPQGLLAGWRLAPFAPSAPVNSFRLEQLSALLARYPGGATASS